MLSNPNSPRRCHRCSDLTREHVATEAPHCFEGLAGFCGVDPVQGDPTVHADGSLSSKCLYSPHNEGSAPKTPATFSSNPACRARHSCRASPGKYVCLHNRLPFLPFHLHSQIRQNAVQLIVLIKLGSNCLSPAVVSSTCTTNSMGL